MRKIALVLAILVSSLGYSQVGERISIEGQISVPSGDDPEGVIIANLSANTVSVSDETGHFNIAVALGDRIKFSALQFEDFSVVIDSNVMSAKKLNVFINLQEMELPEVVVRPFDLSGNIEVDVSRIPVVDANLPDFEREEAFEASLQLPPDSLTSPENLAMRNSFMENGLNFANIFRTIFTTEEPLEKDDDFLSEEIRQLYDDEFFLTHLEIERNQIHNFILYAQDNGLKEEMLDPGNELQLIEFLLAQAKAFNK